VARIVLGCMMVGVGVVDCYLILMVTVTHLDDHLRWDEVDTDTNAKGGGLFRGSFFQVPHPVFLENLSIEHVLGSHHPEIIVWNIVTCNVLCIYLYTSFLYAVSGSGAVITYRDIFQLPIETFVILRFTKHIFF